MIRLPLLKSILQLAWPVIIGYLGQVFFDVANIFWLSRLGPQVVAASGVVSFLLWGFYSLMNTSHVGTQTLVAQFLGSGNSRYRDVIKESFWLSLALSFVFALIFWLIQDALFRFVGLDEATFGLAQDYFICYIFGLPIMFTYSWLLFIFNAFADTKTGNKILLLSLMLNMLLDPLLIFGINPLGIDGLGIMGASLATVLSQAVGIFIGAHLLWKKRRMPPWFEFFKWKFYSLKKILVIGVPSAVSNFTWMIIFIFLSKIITPFGMEPYAALTVAQRIEGIPYFVSLGFATALSVLVARSKGRQEKVGALIHAGLFSLSGFLFFVSLAFIFIPDLLMRLLTPDPLVIAQGVNYLRIVGYFEIFLGWELLLEGVFNGFGTSHLYMWIRLPLTIARIPLSYWLISFWGVEGVWWAVSLTTFLKGLLSYLVLRFFLHRSL